jgi:hypothetical protein
MACPQRVRSGEQAGAPGRGLGPRAPSGSGRGSARTGPRTPAGVHWPAQSRRAAAAASAAAGGTAAAARPWGRAGGLRRVQARAAGPGCGTRHVIPGSAACGAARRGRRGRPPKLRAGARRCRSRSPPGPPEARPGGGTAGATRTRRRRRHPRPGPRPPHHCPRSCDPATAAAKRRRRRGRWRWRHPRAGRRSGRGSNQAAAP